MTRHVTARCRGLEMDCALTISGSGGPDPADAQEVDDIECGEIAVNDWNQFLAELTEQEQESFALFLTVGDTPVTQAFREWLRREFEDELAASAEEEAFR